LGKVSEFRWTKQRSQAAQLVADDRLTDLAIAVEVGISDRQLRRWKHVPKFQAQVEKHVEKYLEDFQARLRAEWPRWPARPTDDY
jgi:histidinol phosphatase-like enzyme